MESAFFLNYKCVKDVIAMHILNYVQWSMTSNEKYQIKIMTNC